MIMKEDLYQSNDMDQRKPIFEDTFSKFQNDHLVFR